MDDLATLIHDLRCAADVLEALTRTPPRTAGGRQETAAVIGGARNTLRELSLVGIEPDDFDRGAPTWRAAREATDGRRILANALSIAAQSMFTAADPIAVTRDLSRAVRGLRRHADLEEALLVGADARNVA